jgi:adenylate cyclase
MTCALCGAGNPEQAAYCGTCGVMLGARCPECQAANHPRARRCGACGAVIQSVEAPRPSARAPRESRRIVTVVFADIVGFTSMVESYGDQAERIRTMLRECFDALASIVLEHGGTVEKFIGDAVCALFGAPVVHEDDPERALGCALQMQRAIERLNRMSRD